MVPSKSREDKSRRSSILKPRRRRQPLQNMNLDSSSNENSPATTSKVKRRVSFAEMTHVVEFCHPSEQGTVWNNTYEERDSSLKGSFTHEQNTGAESKENASFAIFKDIDSDPSYSRRSNLMNDQTSQETVRQKEDAASRISNNTLVSGIVSYNDTNNIEEYVELFNKKSQQFVMSDAISHTSKNAISNNIIYKDFDNEDCASNKFYFELHSNNGLFNSQSDDECMHDSSIELHLHVEKQTNEQENGTIHNPNNLDINCLSNCNNMSMEITEAIQTSLKTTSSNLETYKPISMILQNCKNTKRDGADNNHDNTFPTNLQCNIISEQIESTNNVNDSMVLTAVIQPLAASTCTSNTICDTSMNTINVALSKTYERNILYPCNKDIIKKNDTRQDQTDNIESFNDELMNMTEPVNVVLSSNEFCSKENVKEIEQFNDVPMEMTEPVNVMLSSNEFCSKENVKEIEPVIMNNIATFSHNTSMETIKKMMSTRNGQEISDMVTCKSLSEKDSYRENNANASIFSNKNSLYKSMGFAEDVPVQQMKTTDVENVAQSIRKNICEDDRGDKVEIFNDISAGMIESVNNVSPLNICDKENLKVGESVSRDERTVFFHNVSMEETEAVLLRNQKEITHPIICIENTRDEKDKSNSVCFDERIRLSCKSVEFANSIPVPLYHERTCITKDTMHVAQSTSCMSQTMSETHVPTENIAGSMLEIDAIINKEIENVGIKIDATIPPIMNSMQDASNETEKLNVSKNNVSQSSMINNKTQSVQISRLTRPITQHSSENSAVSTLQTDTVTSETIQNISVEVDTAIPSMLHLTDAKTVNEAENLIIPKDNPTELRESIIKENFVISREIMETTNVHDKLYIDTLVTSPSRNDLDCSSVESARKRRSNENERSLNVKRIRSSPTGPKFSQENNVHLSSVINNDISNIERNKSFVKDILDPDVSASGANLKDSLNEISAYSFLKKSLPYTENSTVELQFIKAPSFICLESEESNSDVEKRPETEECISLSERTEAIIEYQVDPKEYCKEDLNNEVGLQSTKQKEEECIDESLVEEQCISAIEDDFSIKQDPFLFLLKKLEIYAERDDCIWSVYHKDIDRKVIVFGFISNSLLIATSLSFDLNLIKVKITSRLADDAGVLVKIVHRLIQEKIDASTLAQLYGTNEKLFPMLDFISQDVKLAMDFIFDLKRLDDLNLMEITYDEISFISRSKRMDIILKVTIHVKSFDKLTSDDIKVNCILGRIKETDVTNLIKNVKKDHKFLRRYMSDVRNYIDIMGATSRSNDQR